MFLNKLERALISILRKLTCLKLIIHLVRILMENVINKKSKETKEMNFT